MAKMIDFAERYVQRFGAVIPVGAWDFVSKDGEAISMWKRALIKEWQEKPLRSVVEVRRFWENYERRYKKTPGIGIATGQICGGHIVIDLDRHPERDVDGYAELRKWQWETGKTIPDTWTGISGSGGYHLWYKTNEAMRPYANTELGVDLRADGAYIVVAPSLHESGRRYQWEVSPADMECAEADDAVLAFIEHCRPSGSEYRSSTKRGEGGERFLRVPEVIPDGGRHAALVSLIGALNAWGISDEAIIQLVRMENEKKCQPPLTETELQREIFPCVFRWEKGIPVAWLNDGVQENDG